MGTLAEIQAGIDDPTVVDTLPLGEMSPRMKAAIEAAVKTFKWHCETLSSGTNAGIKYAVFAALRSLEHTIEEPPDFDV